MPPPLAGVALLQRRQRQQQQLQWQERLPQLQPLHHEVLQQLPGVQRRQLALLRQRQRQGLPQLLCMQLRLLPLPLLLLGLRQQLRLAA